MKIKSLFDTGIMVVVLFFLLTQGCASQQHTSTPFEPPPARFHLSEERAVPEEKPEAGPVMASAANATHGNTASTGVGPLKTNRLMIYNARLSLIVDNISNTLDKIRKEAEYLHGYMQSMDARTIVIKVPATRLNEMIKKIERLGEVTQKEINGQDVTEEMRDLTIRLKNAEALRERFVRLLERAVNVEDIIKIEKELSRITETIETLKGKIRYLENQIAFSTITVTLNSPLPQQVIKEKIPFPWVRKLGKEIAQGGTEYYNVGAFRNGPKFTLPEAFAKYEETKYLVRATSADGVLIKVEQHENMDGASPEFWTDLIKRALGMEQVISIKSTTEITIGKKDRAYVMQGKKEIGNRTYAYLVCVVMTKKYVYTYEAWGQAEVFQARKTAILDSMKTLKATGF